MAANVAGPVIGLVAGEASGDLLGAHLVEALKSRRPDLQFRGVAGPRMIAAGVGALYPMEKLAVRGYVEVLKHYLEIVSIRRRLRQHFLSNPPVVFIGIDAPDFNLDLELALRQAGIPTIHYVSPSIWAWRGERIHKIKQAADRVLTLFPFEKAIYDQAGIAASYVGHPLADMLHDYPSPESVRARLKIGRNDAVVALLPGSRVSELQNMAQLFADSARQIAKAAPRVKFIAPLINSDTRMLFEQAMARVGGLDILVLNGQSHDAIAASDVALVASGTATLEAALLQRPMVITYRMPRLSWWMMNPRRYQPYVGLPNILAGEFVVPEFLQDAATPENLAYAVVDLLNDAPRREHMRQRFSGMLTALRQNTSQKAADAVMPYLEQRAP